MDVDIRVKYMKHILRGPTLNKYQQVMVEFKDSAMGLAVDQWSLGL